MCTIHEFFCLELSAKTTQLQIIPMFSAKSSLSFSGMYFIINSSLSKALPEYYASLRVSGFFLARFISG